MAIKKMFASAFLVALAVFSMTTGALAMRGGTPTGSSSQNGNAIYLVDYAERGCDGGEGNPNTSDNYITDDETLYVWIKSNEISKDGLPDNWIVEYKGKYITVGTFSPVQEVCGVYNLHYIYWDNMGTPGSYTFTARNGLDSTFASDTARLD